MTPELQNRLNKTFPWFDVYVECGDGWFTLIWDMLREIDDLYFDADREVDIEILQVKEKWGFLRVYYEYPFYNEDLVIDIIGKYEMLSKEICELCGAEGRAINQGGWVITRCEECEKGE